MRKGVTMVLFESKEEKLRRLAEKREQTLEKLREEAEVYKKLNEQQTEYDRLIQEKKLYEARKQAERAEKPNKIYTIANKVLNAIAPIEESKPKQKKAYRKKKRDAWA